jgi:Family of unknown function (DUF5677)
MDVLQEALIEAITSLPEHFLEKLISKKLQDQAITAPKSLPRKIAKHLLSGTPEPFRYRGRALVGNVSLSLQEADADEISRKLDVFCEEQLPKVCRDVAGRISKTILRHLKSQWAQEQARQESDLLGFRRRLESRWGKPLGQLRMLLTMAREWGQWAYTRKNSSKLTGKTVAQDVLTRLHVRACQVTDEILCLLENGFADGAMARWRTLHEIAVVAAVISRHGEDIAKRYVAHQAVESKRAMNKYLDCCAQLGYRSLPVREVRKIQKAYDAAIVKYGDAFKTDYGWAVEHLKNKRPSFVHLEAEAGKAEMRSHYQMGSDNVHAGVKSMYVRLGLVGNYDGLLAGRSNGGLMEPGQNAAHTLTQISIIACSSEPNLDDLVVVEMMRMLRDDIPRSFHAADKQLRKDDKEYRATGNAT